MTVFGSLIAVVIKVSPDWGQVFYGFVPSKVIFQSDGLYTCKSFTHSQDLDAKSTNVTAVGIIGATVMPHGLFLGSSLAKQDRVALLKPAPCPVDEDPFQSDMPFPSGTPPKRPKFPDVMKHTKSFIKSRNLEDMPDCSMGHAGWNNRSLAFVRAHLRHGMVDIVFSLLGFALIINALYVFSFRLIGTILTRF